MEINENYNCLLINKPIYVRAIPPIDFWRDCPEVDGFEKDVILQLMPEDPRHYEVFKTFIPHGCQMAPAYLVKAENNGTVFVFSNYKLELNDSYEGEYWADYSLALQRQK